MNRAYGSLLIMIYWKNWTKVQLYNMCRADGSLKCKSPRGMIHIVATDFNRLNNNFEWNNIPVGMNHIVVIDFNSVAGFNPLNPN